MFCGYWIAANAQANNILTWSSHNYVSHTVSQPQSLCSLNISTIAYIPACCMLLLLVIADVHVRWLLVIADVQYRPDTRYNAFASFKKKLNTFRSRFVRVYASFSLRLALV